MDYELKLNFNKFWQLRLQACCCGLSATYYYLQLLLLSNKQVR